MAQESLPRPITDEEYAQLYITLKRRSNQDAVVRNGTMTPILSKYGGKYIDVMSIGAGVGWLEDELIRHPDIKVNSILAIEPNLEHAEKMREKSAHWKDTDFDIDTAYFNENYNTTKKFDVILVIHSIYYVENPVNAIIKLKSFLKLGGLLLIAVRGKKGGYELMTRVHEYFKLSPSDVTYGSVYSEEMFTDGLKRNGIKYHVEEVMALHDVSDFIEKKATPFSNDCVSFLTHIIYENLDKELQDDLYKIVKDSVTLTKDNRYMFGHLNSFIHVENI